jgi:hypothetical protein
MNIEIVVSTQEEPAETKLISKDLVRVKLWQCMVALSMLSIISMVIKCCKCYEGMQQLFLGLKTRSRFCLVS